MKYRNGTLVRNIVNETGVPRSTLYYWLKKYGDIDNPLDITYKKTLDNVKRKYKKQQRICEV